MIEGYPKTNRLLAVGLILIVFVVLGLAIFEFIYAQKSQNTPDQLTNGSISAPSLAWETIPYFGSNFSFTAGYPENWIMTLDNIEPDLLYDGQPLIAFEEVSPKAGKNNLTINYFFDTGEDLATWSSKRTEILEGQKGYRPVQTTYTINGIEFVQMCFLGSTQYSPLPDCFAYTHVTPYILELRTDSASPTFQAEKYIAEFIKNFSLLQPGDDWSTFSNTDMGVSMKYPEKKYPVVKEASDQVVNFTKQYIGQFFNIQVLDNWSRGPVEFWYEEVVSTPTRQQLLPRKIILGGKNCYYADFDPSFSYEGIIGAMQFLCQVNSRLYVFTISSNDQPIDIDLYKMINSVKFIQ